MDITSLDQTVSAICAILSASYAIDLVLFTQNNKEPRERVSLWFEEKDSFRNSITKLSVFFNEFFDGIYGKYFFSLKRFIRSCTSSLIAITIIAIYTGPTKAFSELTRLEHERPIILLTLVFGNLIADYISLQETKSIMNLSKKIIKIRFSTIYIFIIFIADIAITTIITINIWMLSLLLMFGGFMAAIQSIITNNFFYDVLDITYKVAMDLLSINSSAEANEITKTSNYGVLFYSTFFTSFLWLLFVACFFILKIISLIHPVIKSIMLRFAETKRPTTALGTIISLGLILNYAFSQILALWS